MSQETDREKPKTAEHSASESKVERSERIFLVPYPKIIFLYPTVVASLVAALWLTITGNTEPTVESPAPVALTAIFLGILAVNLVVLSVDFPRATSLTLFFIGSTLLLGGVVIVIVRPDLVPLVQDFIGHIRPVANATFFWIVFTVMFLILLIVKVMVQFDYWEVRRNEVLHHHGILSDLRRYPTTGLQVEKEINDVFEFFLMRSGRLIIRPQGESRSFVLDNVPFISSKENKITRLLSSVKVKVQSDG